MAYKFQKGAAVLSGALTQEGAITIDDESGNSNISLSQGGIISGSNDGRFLALDINSNANVIDSSANFSGGSVTAEGTISGSGDLHLATAIDIDGSQVLSKTTLGSTVLASSLTSVGTLSSLNVGNVTSTGILSGTNATLAVGGAVSIGGASVLNATTLGSAVAASSLTSVGTLVGLTSSQPIIAQVGVRSSGPLSGSGDLTLGPGSDMQIGGTDVLSATTLGSTVVASSLTSVGTLSSLAVGAVTSTGIISSSAGVSGSAGKFLGYVSASHFSGNGAGLTNIGADPGGSDTQVQFNNSDEFGGDAGFTYNENGGVTLSGSSAGRRYNGIDLDAVANEKGLFHYNQASFGGPNVEVLELMSNTFCNVSGTSGVSLLGGEAGYVRIRNDADNANLFIANPGKSSGGSVTASVDMVIGGHNTHGGDLSLLLSSTDTSKAFRIQNNDQSSTLIFLGRDADGNGRLTVNNGGGAVKAFVSSSGVISASSDLTLGAGADVNIGGSNVLSRGTLGSTVLASSLTSLGTQGEALNMGGYGISNVGGLTSSLGVKVGGYGLWTNDITRSAGDLNIKLHDASANNVGFRLASGTKPLVVYSTNYVAVTSLTASSGVQFDSTVQLDGAGDVSASIQADSVYFRDASNGLIKRESFVDIVSAIAGAGITATGGVLSTQAQSVTSGSNAFGAVTLVEGYNYFGDVTGTMVATLPASPTVGDVVNVKAKSITSTESIKITGSAAHTIDGDGYINIESSYGAVGLVYVASNDWRVV